MLFSLPVYTNTSQNLSNLPQGATSILQRHKIPQSSLSIYAVDLDTGQPIIMLNENTPRNPASAIKVLTTYAGLELLGPAYLWETRFYLDGVLNNGTLNGNLIFQGGGDPFLSRESFWHMLHTLRARGLKHINGDFVIDHSLFENETGSTGDFDGRPYHAYNAFPHAALVNFNAQEFFIIPQQNGVLVYADPPAENVQIRNNLKLVSGRCWAPGTGANMNVNRQGSQVIVEFTGNYPAACGEQTIQRSVISPDQFVYGTFKALWEEMGGTINGHYRSGPHPGAGLEPNGAPAAPGWQRAGGRVRHPLHLQAQSPGAVGGAVARHVPGRQQSLAGAGRRGSGGRHPGGGHQALPALGRRGAGRPRRLCAGAAGHQHGGDLQPGGRACLRAFLHSGA